MKMEINFSMTSDYCSIDELDSETREDLEVALYGMLHHASNDEDYFLNSSNNPENVLPLSTVMDQEGNNVCATNNSVNYSSERPRTEKSKAVKLESVTPPKNALNQASKQSTQNSEHSKQTKLSCPSKTNTIRNSKISEHKLKKNPYSQYLIIEDSSNSKNLKKKPCEVITLSDEEDSKYATINKSSKLSVIKRGLSVGSALSDKFPEVPCAYSPSVEDSESDNSVTVLDPPPRPSCLDLFSSSNSSTDSSDSEVKILQPSKTNYGKVNIKLNIRQPDIESSVMNATNSPETSLNWEKYSSTKWTPDMIKFYDKDGFDRDLDVILKSFPKNVKWHLDIEDRRGPDLQRNRYFGKGAKIKCTNCNQWDHAAKNCRDPKKVISCSMCGMLGHNQYRCPKKMCLGCGRPSEIFIECCPECRRERNIVCMICRSKHVTQRCPDLWRRYHSTTSDVEELNNTGSTLKPKMELYCCNCSSRGHLVHECPEKRWSKYMPSNPTICSYENPRQFLNNVTNDGKSSVSISENGKEVWVVGTNEQYRSPGKVLNYTMPLDNQPSEYALQAARDAILREIKQVAICWRKQPKKGRFLVEFSGQGDKKEAKYRFKNFITFKKKAGLKNNSAGDNSNQRSPSKLVKEKKFVAPNVVPVSISAIDINHVSREGKHMHRHIPVCITEKKRKNVGKFLTKLEFKHRVQITSCYLGKKWEITIHKLPNGNALSAVNSIVSHLDTLSTRPGGA